jgi:putative membrane protein
MRTEPDRELSVWRGAAAGAIGGAVASSAMVLFNHVLGATGLGREDRGRRKQHRRADAKPNDTDGTISDEPASQKAASNIAEAVTGQALSEREKEIGGPIVHHAFGAAAGALYGAAAAAMPKLASGGGLPYGVLVWLAGAEGGLPLAGLSRSPASYPPARHAASLATHLVFGGTLEAVRRAMTRR